MTTKHTDGEWWRDGLEVGAGPMMRIKIAKVSGVDYEQAVANARLISAAPNLLEALRGLDEAYCRAGTHLTREERTEDRKRLIAARAAIAKAT